MKLKIKPTKKTVALRKVKFRKESDFNKFLKIVSKNTKELERIKLPSKGDVKKKSRFNLLPLLALGALIAALAGKKKGDTDGVDGGVDESDLSTGDRIDSITNVSRKIQMNNKRTKTNNKRTKINNKRTKTNNKRTKINNRRTNNRRTNQNRRPTPKKKRIIPRSNRNNKIDTKSRFNIKDSTKRILGNIWRIGKNISTLATGNPWTITGAAIFQDVFNRGVADGTMEAHKEEINRYFTTDKDGNMVRKGEENNNTNPWVYKPGKGFESIAERQKNNINKEIDQLVLTRSQLDPKDTKNYKILTDKIATLALEVQNITPEIVEQQFIKSSFTNPVIFYPIDSESSNLTSPLLNTPNLYSAPSSQSFTGNNIIDSESDSLNISDLFLLNKLSH